MDSAITTIFQLAILIFSVVIHEVSHGLTANALGDPTAKYAGRLTLNPLKHLDPVGSVIVPFITFVIPRLLGSSGVIIGLAKPVPYNPYYLQVRNRSLGAAIVGIAGPGANILIAVVFGLLVRTANFWGATLGAIADPLVGIMGSIAFVNLMLAVFNLVPIPPLDGSKVLFSILPAGWGSAERFLEEYGFLLLLFFIYSYSHLITPVVLFLFRLIVGLG